MLRSVSRSDDNRYLERSKSKMNAKEFDKYFLKSALHGVWVGAQPAIFLFQFLFQGPKFVVLNQDESDGKGLHLVVVFVPYSGPLEFFDPFGESPETYKKTISSTG